MADETGKVNREYKDRLFRFVFQRKEDALDLYNAINDTDYDNPEDVEINTIEDVVYMGMKNDISFLVKDVLNLYEHQSTFSPNLPLRGVFYFSDLYRKIIGNNRDIYSSKQIPLPYPQFVVFYNGTKEEPERQILELNAAFPEGSNKEEAALQCRAVVLNINLGHNAKIMKKCKKLKEYAEFIECVRKHLREGRPVREAVDTAVSECIEADILKEVLKNNREEVCSMLLTEYDEQAHIENEREIAKEEGRQEGIRQGIEQGKQQGEISGTVKGIIEMGTEFGLSKEDILERIQKKLNISLEEAKGYLKAFAEQYK